MVGALLGRADEIAERTQVVRPEDRQPGLSSHHPRVTPSLYCMVMAHNAPDKHFRRSMNRSQMFKMFPNSGTAETWSVNRRLAQRSAMLALELQ